MEKMPTNRRKYKNGDLVMIPANGTLIGRIVDWNSGYKVLPEYLGLGTVSQDIPAPLLKIPRQIRESIEPATLSKIVLANNVVANSTIIDLDADGMEGKDYFMDLRHGFEDMPCLGRLRYIRLAPLRSNYSRNISRYSVNIELKDCYFCSESDGRIINAVPYRGLSWFTTPGDLVYNNNFANTYSLVVDWYKSVAVFTVSGTIL